MSRNKYPLSARQEASILLAIGQRSLACDRREAAELAWSRAIHVLDEAVLQDAGTIDDYTLLKAAELFVRLHAANTVSYESRGETVDKTRRELFAATKEYTSQEGHNPHYAALMSMWCMIAAIGSLLDVRCQPLQHRADEYFAKAKERFETAHATPNTRMAYRTLLLFWAWHLYQRQEYANSRQIASQARRSAIDDRCWLHVALAWGVSRFGRGRSKLYGNVLG